MTDKPSVAIATKTISHVWSAPVTNLAAAEQITTGDFPLLEIKETSDGKLLTTGGDGALWMMNTDGSQLTHFSAPTFRFQSTIRLRFYEGKFSTFEEIPRSGV